MYSLFLILFSLLFFNTCNACNIINIVQTSQSKEEIDNCTDVIVTRNFYDNMNMNIEWISFESHWFQNITELFLNPYVLDYPMRKKVERHKNVYIILGGSQHGLDNMSILNVPRLCGGKINVIFTWWGDQWQLGFVVA